MVWSAFETFSVFAFFAEWNSLVAICTALIDREPDCVVLTHRTHKISLVIWIFDIISRITVAVGNWLNACFAVNTLSHWQRTRSALSC
jgi:hypothetical protein